MSAEDTGPIHGGETGTESLMDSGTWKNRTYQPKLSAGPEHGWKQLTFTNQNPLTKFSTYVG